MDRLVWKWEAHYMENRKRWIVALFYGQSIVKLDPDKWSFSRLDDADKRARELRIKSNTRFT